MATTIKVPNSRHRAPSIGYKSKEKQAYRRAVWASMTGAIKIANDSPDSRPLYILMLPGLATKEIDVAIRFGLRKDRIVLVHESKEHVESEAEWRVKYPDMKYYTGLLSDVLETCKKEKIQFAGANLDFCGNFSSETIEQYSAFCDYYTANQSDNKSLTVGVTIMKGREAPSMVRMLEKLHTRSSPVGLKEKRLETLVREFGVQQKVNDVMYIGQRASSINVLTEGDYIHHKAPMAYCVVEYVQPNAFIEKLVDDCRKEAQVVYKQFKKMAPKKLPSLYDMKTEEEFVAYVNKRNELLGVAEKLLSPDYRRALLGGVTSLHTFFNLTGGHRTKVTTLCRRFLSKKECEVFENTLRSYSISSITSLDYSICTWKDRNPIYIPGGLSHVKDKLEKFLAVSMLTQ